MCSLRQSSIPPPLAWTTFESICLAALKVRWQSPNLQKNGRAGQPQHGVDIYGDGELDLPTGVQCKLTDQKLTLASIEDEISKAEQFLPTIAAYCIATTAAPDAELQTKLRIISRNRIAKGKFPVTMIYWNEIVGDLLKNKDEFTSFYPELTAFTSSAEANSARLLAILDIAYFAPFLLEYLQLIYGDSLHDPRDPFRFQAAVCMIEAAGAILMKSETAKRLEREVTQINSELEKMLRQQEDVDWKEVELRCASIKALVLSMEAQFTSRELAFFRLGRALGWWSVAAGDIDGIPDSIKREVSTALGTVADGPFDKAAINAIVSACEEDPDNIRNVFSAHNIYNIFRRGAAQFHIGPTLPANETKG